MKYMNRICLVTMLLGATAVMAESNRTMNGLSMEEQIKKALGEVEPIKVMKTTASKIISESKAEVLDEDKPKIEKREMVKNKKRVAKKVKKKLKQRVKKVVIQTEDKMDSLPMARTYSMDYDVSKIKE